MKSPSDASFPPFSNRWLLVLALLVGYSRLGQAQAPNPPTPASAASGGEAGDAASAKAAGALPAWPSLEVPSAATTAELVPFVEQVKKLQPTTPEQYREMQTLIRESSRRILELTQDRASPMAKVAEFDFMSSSLMLMGNEGPEAQSIIVGKYRDYLKQKKQPDNQDLQMSLLAMQNLEQSGDRERVATAYREFAAILKAKRQEALQVWIELLEANAKRVELPGKTMSITGKTIAGDDFDLRDCLGKHTLVYFWSSWCKPCREEYPYMRELYRQYRDRGFEIVAISVDEEKGKLEAFLRELEVPWTTLWDPQQPSTPQAVQDYGISTIPSMILLDQQGKVVSLEARGLILGSLLEKAIGPAGPTPAPTPPPTPAP
jgi:thiol-disulfide isomerase/thioredoxin